MADERALQRKPAAAARRPTAATRPAAAAAPSHARPASRTLQQRLGNQGTQALAARVVARAAAPGMAAAGVGTGQLTVSQPGDALELEADRVADAVMSVPAPSPAPDVQGTRAFAARAVARASAPVVAPAGRAGGGQLALSQPGDAHEREADGAAERVMRLPKPASSPPISSPPTRGPAAAVIQRRCSACDEETTTGLLQRKESSAQAMEVTSSVSANIGALRGGGNPLPEATRAFFEPRFGANFSGVRVHSGSQAAETASAISARAFTVGNDIAFNAGEYAPQSQEGQRLLAHELAHVVQQQGGNAGGTARSDGLERKALGTGKADATSNDAEAEADAAEEAVLRIEGSVAPVTLSRLPVGLYAKKEKPSPDVPPPKGTYTVKKGRGAYTYVYNAQDLAGVSNVWEFIFRRHFRNVFPAAPPGAEQAFLNSPEGKDQQLFLDNVRTDDKGVADHARKIEKFEVQIVPSLHQSIVSWMKANHPGVKPASPLEATHALEEGAVKPPSPPPPAGVTTTVQGRGIILPGNLKPDQRDKLLKTLAEILAPPDPAPQQAGQPPPPDLTLSLKGVELLLQVGNDSDLIARMKAAGPARKGGPDFEQSLEIVIANQASERARKQLGLDAPTGARRDEPIENRPVHGQIKNITGPIVIGQEARFVFEVLDDRDAFRVPIIAIHWYAFPKGKPNERVDDEITRYVAVRGQSALNDKIFNVKFPKAGEYEIQAFVSHNFFLPAWFPLPNGIRVYTEIDLAKELNKEALQDFAQTGVTTKHLFDPGGELGGQMGFETRGKLDPKATILTIENRLKTVADEEKMVRELIASYKSQVGSEARAIVKWAENYLEELQKARTGLKKDKGGVPLGVRGVFVSREGDVPSKALTLLCYFFRTADGYTLVLRDFTRLYEQEDYRFEAKDTTVEKSEEKIFNKQADAYPLGTLSITFQTFDETTRKPKDEFVRFEKITDTVGKHVKKVLFSTTVDIAVNLFAAILMIIPGLQILGIVLAIAYNTAKTVSELEDAANKGTLTAGKISVGLAQIALNALPLAGRGAKLMTIAGRTFHVMEAVNIAGNILLITHQGMGEVDKLRNGIIKELAQVDGEIRALERTNQSDPKLPELKAKRRALIKEGEAATVTVFTQLLAQQALMMVGQHLVMGYMSRKFSIGEMRSAGFFRHEKDAKPGYDYKNGVIVGDELKITPLELERMQVRHAQNKALEGTLANPGDRQQVIEAFGDRPVEIRTGAKTTALKQEGANTVLEVAEGAKVSDILPEAKRAQSLPQPKPETTPKGKGPAEAGKPAPEDSFKPVDLSGAKQFDDWKGRLKPDTAELLQKNPKLEKVFAEMDPLARDLLTLCNSPCIPETATKAQGDRITAILKKHQIKPGSETFEYLREHLHNPKNRNNLEPAIKELEGLKSKAELQAKIEAFIKAAAKAKDLTATRRPDGKWEVTTADNVKVVEYGIQPHDEVVGTRSFFQSHHGIQGAWGRARVKGYVYEKSPTILLRDSKMGSPHQIVSARQKAREGQIGKSNYGKERQNLLDDMAAAGVPKTDADALLASSDAFFAKLYDDLKKKNTGVKALKDIFGDWTP